MDSVAIIQAIVDQNLNSWVATGLNSSSLPIHPLMADEAPSAYEGYWSWKPIASTVTVAQLASYEIAIGYRLPPDYKFFLQHKHFYELHIGLATFFKHPVDSWLSILFKEVYHGWPREKLINKGLIPFAMYQDWGMLCFDTNRNQEDCNYPVVLWDHEQEDCTTAFSPSFAQLLPQLEQEAYGSSESQQMR